MGNKFILYVRGGNDWTETDACFVEVDEVLARKIKTRIALAKAAKADDPDFRKLCFWDGTPLFFPSECYGDDFMERVQDEQQFEAPENITEESVPAVRVESILMHVTDEHEDRLHA